MINLLPVIIINANIFILDRTYTIKIEKKHFGEIFTDLDMIQKLLKKENLNAERNGEIVELETEQILEENIESWEIVQKIETENINTKSTYGFANSRADIFQKLSEEATELFEDFEIAKIENNKRAELRIQCEQR